jgi:hypothetical protein
MPNRLVGDWTLVSYDAIAPDGTRSLPFGRAVGRLSYGAHGHMAGHVMRPDRAPVDVPGNAQRFRAAYTGYIGYFGTYEVDDAGDRVVHHVEGALNPSWVGGDQVRRMKFEGDLLVLEADVEKNGERIRHVLTWRKLP